MDYFEKLCGEMQEIIEEHKAKDPYNIFQVLEISQKEVMMCRVLTDLLNPFGRHKQGARYLRIFMKKILGIEDDEEMLPHTYLYKEYPITGNRRIDIVIKNKNRFLPMEVKINAGEQENQCYDYYQFAKKYDRNTKIIYLTKWGTMPSEYSLRSSDSGGYVPEDKIMCISFAEDITKWLKEILKDEQGIMANVIEQYLDAVYDFTVDEKKELGMKISDKIMEKEEYFRAALEVEACINTVKAKLIYKVFQEFERQMKPFLLELGLEREKRFSYYEYEEQANEDFYKKSDSTYPGINYVVKRARLENGMEVWFRIEVNWKLFVGLCVFDPDAEGSDDGKKGWEADEITEDMANEILWYLNLPDIEETDSWWIDWWYIPNGTYEFDSEVVPDFKNMNEAAVRLSNEDNLKEFVKECIEVIKSILKKIIVQPRFLQKN